MSEQAPPQTDDPAAAAIAYAEVADLHPDTPAAAWARVGEGRALYAQGEFAKSIVAYEAALEASEDESLQWAALEGLAAIDDVNQRLRESLDALRRTILETGFNYSSEHQWSRRHLNPLPCEVPESFPTTGAWRSMEKAEHRRPPK